MRRLHVCSAICLFSLTLTASSFSQEVADLLRRAQIDRGVCCVVGASDGSLAIRLARESEMLIHVREPNREAAENLRDAVAQTGFTIQELLVEQGALDRLPHATNSLDLLIAQHPETTKVLSLKETLRALRPDGVAIVGGGATKAQLAEWTESVDGVMSWTDAHGDWVLFRKPIPAGRGDWTHWEKSPDNNPVASDTLIKAPYMTQFMATPYYIGMPSVTTAAGGRTFLAMGHIAHHEREWGMLNRVLARNGYNGTILWERELPDDYLVHRSAFIASDDEFYMINGNHVLRLDARTGAERGKIEIPGFNGQWKWIAMRDGILYALAGEPGDGVELVKGNRALGGWSWADLSKGYYGKRIPHGFGDVLVAYDLAAQEAKWLHREDSLIDSRGLAIRDNRLLLYCPDKHFRCLDPITGEVLWTANDAGILSLIEEPGRGLTSTPGWRTQTLVVATPDAYVVQGQTRMNVVGLSTRDGSLLWVKPKVTNNPNAIYVDGKVIVGVGERGSHVVLDPKTGQVEEDLKFVKRACTRLTASTDSFFVRGEGMARFDRQSKRLDIDGAARPACNDGVIPANGLIYLGPWACDCNLSLIGNVARCSAGDFRFDLEVDIAQRREIDSQPEPQKTLAVSELDWSTYRGNLRRSAATKANVQPATRLVWQFRPQRPFVASDATTAGDLILLGGEDGKVRAIDHATGELRWSFVTGGPIKYPPTVAQDRAYVGSGDGFAYCLEAATGRLLWRFRAAPVERKIMVYGSLSSTWPVNSGVVVQDDVAYFAAGIIDHDGTYVYAVDARTGDLVWQNNRSGHLNALLRKGVSVQGNLTILGDTLVLAGGNVVSPARYDLKTGKCLETARQQGQPQANGGKFVGVFDENRLVAGGRILYSSPRNVSTKGSFQIWSEDRQSMPLNYGGIVPAWNDQVLAVANFKYGRITALETATVADKVTEGFGTDATRNRFARTIVNTLTARDDVRWQSNLGDSNGFEALSIAVAKNAVVSVARYQDLRRAVPQYFLTTLNLQNGNPLSQVELPAEPLPGGVAIDRDGRIIVVMLNGDVACFGR